MISIQTGIILFYHNRLNNLCTNPNGVEIHLFEVDNPGEYKYLGVVELAGQPYQEIQPDQNGAPRKVWMFPLRKLIAE